MPLCSLCGFPIADVTAGGMILSETFAADLVFAISHRVHQRINGVLQPVIELAP